MIKLPMGTGPKVRSFAAWRAHDGREIVGNGRAMTALAEEIALVAKSDATVLITGESGVGKGLVAREIHSSSPRASNVFAPVSCVGLSDALLESELFGRVKGSAARASGDAAGKLNAARGGTVFLDEIGDMPQRIQPRLLRFLESEEARKAGSTCRGRDDVRLVAATRRSLRAMMTQGTFCQDLFERLQVIHVAVPPLRERREDIPALVNHIVQRHVRLHHLQTTTVSEAAMNLLVEYSWPGNVRELENVVERLILGVNEGVIDVDDLPPEILSEDSTRRAPTRERWQNTAQELFSRIVNQHESFWSTVYLQFVGHEITRATVRDIVRRGLAETEGSYEGLARLFNLKPCDHQAFLNFLRKHDCQVPFTPNN